MTSYGIIGNGAFGAVIDNRSRIVWCCLDSFGGDPIFNSLLNNDSDEGGFLDVSLANLAKTEQKYIPSTAVLVTTLVSASGDVLQIKDFAPRFAQSGAETVTRPSQIFRIITRVRGDPVATVRVRPSFEYNSAEGYQTRGSHHIRYCGTSGTLRLSTNAPIQLLMDESAFLVHEPIYLVFGPDESVTPDLAQLCREYEDRTIRHWKQWAACLSLPVDYQELLVRTAITVQLLQSEELGGLVNALTLGIPLGSDLPPSRDERTFQITDACVSVPVLRQIGLFQVVKRFTTFLKSIALKPEPPQAIYGPLGQSCLSPTELSGMAGYLGVGPAMAGGVAASLVRDVPASGLLIVGLSGAFFDVRMKDLCSPRLFEHMEQLGMWLVKSFSDMMENKGLFSLSAPGMLSCEASKFFEDDMAFLSVPDVEHVGARAGPVAVHTLSSVLCWAAADRLARVSEHWHWVEKSKQWHGRAAAMREAILLNAVDPTRNVITSFWRKDKVGPGVLRLAELGFIAPTDPLFVRTVEAFEIDALSVCFSRTPVGNRSPEWAALAPASPIQTSSLLWYIEALRSVGRVEQARSLFHAVCASSNECGLLSQSIDLKDGRHWGNLAHLPTLLGLIRVGSRLSREWRGI